MNSGSIRARDYLAHMLDAVSQIQAYTLNKSAEDFAADRLLQDGVIRNVEYLERLPEGSWKPCRTRSRGFR